MAGNQQRNIQTQKATVDAGGFCTFVFPAPPQGTVLTGTVSVVDATASNTWTLYLGAGPQGDIVTGTPIASSKGTSAIHSVQQQANEVLTMQAVNMTPGVVRTCTFHSVGSDARTTPLRWPINSSQATGTATDQISLIPWGAYTIGGGGTWTMTVPVPTSLRSVTTVLEPLTGGAMGVNAYGNNSAIGFASQTALGFANETENIWLSFDTQVTVVVAGPAGGTFNLSLIGNTDVTVVATQQKPYIGVAVLGNTSLASNASATVFTDASLGNTPTLFVQYWWLAVLTPATAGNYSVTLAISSGLTLYSCLLGPSSALNIVGNILNAAIPIGGTITVKNNAMSPAAVEVDCGVGHTAQQ